MGTGTAANGLCASIIAAPYGAIYVSDAAHVHGSECGGAEFWSGGNARTVPLPVVDGKIAAADLARAVDEAGARSADVPPRAVSLTQATEVSTVYTPAEVKSVAEAAHARRLWVHMDGARFANAVARLGCTPAEASWKAGVDVLSFGATKNGALAAEAVVFFDRALAETMRYRRRRGGHLFSKMRFLSTQLEAFIAKDLWLRNARHANAMAQRVGRAWPRSPACGSAAQPRSTSSSSPCRRPSGTGSWPRATASPGAARPAKASSGSPAPSTRGRGRRRPGGDRPPVCRRSRGCRPSGPRHEVMAPAAAPSRRLRGVHVPIEELRQNRFIVGDPAYCIEQIELHRERLGIQEMGFRLHWPGMPHERVLRPSSLLGERALPHFA